MRRPPLKKTFGQHHLRDAALCRPLVDFLQPAGHRVVEIGPGGGVLTSALVAAGAEVLALEVDLAWTFHLRHRQPSLALAAIDAGDVSWQRLPPATLVAGNLPFNVGTALIAAILPHAATIPRAAFMVQKEVAERLVARPGTATYSSTSVLTAAYARARELGRVRPGSFIPPPRVTASFIGFELRQPPLPAAAMPVFEQLVRTAFNQRRKTLRNTLAAAWGRELSERVLAARGIDQKCRAQELALADFVAIYETWQQLSAAMS